MYTSTIGRSQQQTNGDYRLTPNHFKDNMYSMSEIKAVDEVNYGVYVWNVTGRGILVNEDRDPLRISSMRGDLSKIRQLKDAAASYGYPDGEPVFWSGRRAISDAEYDEQMARHTAGQLADPYDIPALIEQQKAQRANGGS